MDWFKHSTTMSQSRKMRALEQTYGFQGLGLFWKIYEKIQHSEMGIPLEEVLSWSKKSFPRVKILSFVTECGLFCIDDLDMVLLIEELEEPSSVNNSQKNEITSEKNAEVEQKNEVTSEKNAEVEPKNEVTSEKNTEQMQSNAPTRKEKTREEKNRKEKNTVCKKDVAEPSSSTTQTAEEAFYREMREHCPRVCRMRDPLTYQQFLRIQQHGYTREQIAQVLQAMENCASLLKDYVSANLTVLNWLNTRKKNKTL